MLVNKIPAFGAIVPKDVLNSSSTQNFKTKPMGLDSVSFGMANVPCTVTGEKPDVSPEKLQTIYENDMRKFEPIIKYYSANKCAGDFADVLRTNVAIGKDDNTYSTSFLYAMGTSNFNDGYFEMAIKTLARNKEMLSDSLSQKFEVPNYKEGAGESLTIEDSTIQLVARRTNSNRLKAIIDSFDKEKPEDNQKLAKLMATIDPPTIKKQCQESYFETVKRLALNCRDIPNDQSIGLVEQLLKADFVESSEKEKLEDAKAWMLK